jgi:hypothetical protein
MRQKGVPGASLYSAQKATCQEWASVDDPDTPGKPYKRYEQQGNHATTRAPVVAVALNSMRDAYKAEIAKRISPRDAWRSVTGQATAARTHEASTRQNIRHRPYGEKSQKSSLRQSSSPSKENGIETRLLQEAVHDLGYRGSHGNPLAIDGVLGPNTLTPSNPSNAPTISTLTALSEGRRWPHWKTRSDGRCCRRQRTRNIGCTRRSNRAFASSRITRTAVRGDLEIRPWP